MALDIDPKIDVSEAPTITLAGRQFFVPLLVLRQVVKIGPHMPAALRFMNRVMPAALRLGKEKRIKDDDRLTLIEAASLSENEQELALKIIVAALTRAYPKATIDDLMDMPIKSGELVIALPTVFAQVHGKTAEEPKPGEAEAAS